MSRVSPLANCFLPDLWGVFIDTPEPMTGGMALGTSGYSMRESELDKIQTYRSGGPGRESTIPDGRLRKPSPLFGDLAMCS